MTDDRVETHVVIDDPESGERKAVHFQEYWIRHQAAVPAHAVVPIGIEDAKPGPGVARGDHRGRRRARAAVQPGRLRRHHPRRARRARARSPTTAAPVVGVSGIIGQDHVRGMARQLLEVIGVEVSAAGVAEHYGARGARRRPRRLAGRHHRRGRRRADHGHRAPLPRRTAVDDRPRRDRRHGGRGPRPRPMSVPMSPARGLAGRRHRRGGRGHRPRCRWSRGWTSRDGDIVLVTSKVVSKAEGRVAGRRARAGDPRRDRARGRAPRARPRSWRTTSAW